MSDPSFLQYLLITFIIGMVCGLLPYLVGNYFYMRRHALSGLIASTISGLLGSLLLALPVALIFTGVILYKVRQEQ